MTTADRRLSRFCLLLVAAVVLAALAACKSGPTHAVPDFVAGECPMKTPARAEVECGTVEVPRDRSQEDSGTYKLAVAVLRSEADEPAVDPVVYLAGGPGENALDTLQYVYEDLFEAFLETRDVVIFDQRGAGYSEPDAECPELDALTIEQLDDAINDDASIDEASRQMVSAANACRDRLSGEGISLADLSSAESAQDTQAIMRSLGYEEWNLLGVSYGTRLAQTIMRDVPDGVRSVVLDSVVPIEADMIASMPANFARALDALFTACAEAPTCAEDYPDLEGTLMTTVQSLNQIPRPGKVTDQLSVETYESIGTGYTLANVLFQALYSTEIIPLLPEVIQISSGHSTAWMDLLRGINLANAELISTGMQIALQCREEVAFTSQEDIAEASQGYERVRQMLEGSRPIGSEVLEVCEHWALPDAPNVEDEPVNSDLPTLVMAGRFDPVTPPSGGQQVADRLENATFVEFPKAGHAALTSGECATSMAISFLDDPEAAVDTSCADEDTNVAWVRPVSATEFQPFESRLVGVRGVRPVGWTSSLPGTYSRTELGLTSVVQTITPGLTGPEMVEAMASSLPGDVRPEEVEPFGAQAMQWHVYRAEAAGQLLLMAYGGDGSSVPFIVVTGLTGQEALLREYLLVPLADAIEAL